MKDKSVDEIKAEFEEAGASVTQGEPTPYKPREIRWKDNEEQERIEAAIRDRDSLELVNGDPAGPTTETLPKVVDPIEMLNDFIRGR